MVDNFYRVLRLETNTYPLSIIISKTIKKSINMVRGKFLLSETEKIQDSFFLRPQLSQVAVFRAKKIAQNARA